MAHDAGERTEQATPRKREQARRRGDVAVSKDLSTALGLFAFALFLRTGGDALMLGFAHEIHTALSDLGRGADVPWLTHLSSAARRALSLLAPALAVTMAVPLLAHLVQTRFLIAPEKLSLDLARVDPIKGFGRLFSIRQVVDLGLGILKVGALAVVAFGVVRSELDAMVRLPATDLATLGSEASRIAVRMAIGGALVLTAFGALDYGIRWRRHEEDLKMSRQEIKDEHKEQEGDPQLRARRERTRRELAAMRMMSEVPNADVVVRNPTHYAVALRYERGKDTAPVVLAKGADLVALRIIAIAEANGVVVLEDKPLARALFASVEIGGSVPPDLYRAVAEVLAYVYKLKRKLGGSRWLPA